MGFKSLNQPEFPESKENSSVHERLAGAVGHPLRVSRKGKAGPLEAGRGKYSPPANPKRVTAVASERRDGGVLQLMIAPFILAMIQRLM